MDKTSREEFTKLNVDASFNSDTGSGLTGAIIRDHQVFVVSGGRWLNIEHVDDAATGEAHALRNGLLLAEDIGC